MKDSYWKRLKNHSGLGTACFLTVFMFLAAASNKTVNDWRSLLLLGGIGSIIIWSIVLISNIKK